MNKCTPFYRQLLVACTSHLAGLSVGTLNAYPIVLLHQLPADPNVSMDLDTSTWIASVYGIAGTLSIFTTHLMQWKGRKFAFIISTLSIIIGWTLLTVAKNANTIIIGQSFHGFGGSGTVIVCLVAVSEMINPKSRGLAMLLFGVFQSAGLILVTIAGHFLHYKTVGVILCVPVIISLLMSFMWPDSPSWLACKGEFGKCEEIFTWLRGSSEDARRELNELISAQKKALNEKLLKTSFERKQKNVNKFFEKIKRRDFYVPIACMLLITFTFYGSGVYVTYIYGIQMVETMTGTTNSVTHLVLFEVTIVVSCTLAIIFEKHCKNKQMFLFGGISSIIFLLFSCIVHYLNSAGILPKGSNLFLYCFLGSMMANISGLSCAVFIVSAELIPVKHRGIGGGLYIITICSFHTISIKTAPYLFQYIGIWGAYALYLIIAVVGYFLIWKYIPETKRRTLQEIEDYFNYGEFRDTVKDDMAVKVPIITSE